MTNTLVSASIAEDALFKLSPAVLWLRDDDGSIAFYKNAYKNAPARRFSRLETDVLNCLAAGATKSELLDKIDIAPSVLIRFLESLINWGQGVLHWQDTEISRALSDHNRLIEAARLRDIATAMHAKTTTNDEFHRVKLADATRQFDQIETTISHIFREPHIALDNRNYGQAFCDWLVTSGRIGLSCRIIEIGCGLGYFANAILSHLEQAYPEIYDSLSYSLFELSPELQSAQRSHCSRHAGKTQFISANIETYDFDDQRFDLVLSNEVIADLSVATISLDNIDSGSPRSEAEMLAARYELACVPIMRGKERLAVINLGAMKMLENIAKCLNTEGHAVITEYGSGDRSPKAVPFANHDEYTVHFGQLERVARQLGFHSSREVVGDVIGFDAQCDTIRMESLRTLCDCLLPYLGREPLPVLAYTPAALEEVLGDMMAKIGNIQFLALGDPSSFSPFRFELLSLSRNGGFTAPS